MMCTRTLTIALFIVTPKWKSLQECGHRGLDEQNAAHPCSGQVRTLMPKRGQRRESIYRMVTTRKESTGTKTVAAPVLDGLAGRAHIMSEA